VSRSLFTIKLQEALREDERFRALTPTRRLVLSVAVSKWCNDAGTFWPSRRTWALEAGVAPSTVATTVRLAAHVGTLTVTQRWNQVGDRTSNLYAVDATLVGAATAAVEGIIAGRRGGSDADGGTSDADPGVGQMTTGGSDADPKGSIELSISNADPRYGLGCRSATWPATWVTPRSGSR
jgi:hypothetical protein